MDPVIVIGFGMGAMGAIKAYLRANSEGEVVVVEKRDFDNYSPFGMPWVVSGDVPDHDHLKHTFPSNPRLTKLLRTEAISIDPARRIVKIRGVDDEIEEDLHYSTLLLDNGSIPKLPPIPFEKNLLNNGIYTFNRPEDVDLIQQAIPPMEKVAVIGAGATGMEISQALHAQGKEIILVERMSQPFPGLFDPYMGNLAATSLPYGIETRFNTYLKAIEGQTHVEAVFVGDERIPVDTVVLCIGIEPNIGIARDAGLKVNPVGIVVDKTMRTSDLNIYAVGDCIQSWNRITGYPMRSRLAAPALQQGTVAGLNIAGKEAIYHGSLNAFVTLIGGIEFATVGLSDSELQESVSVRVRVKNKPDYMTPDDVTLKLIANSNGKVLGARIIGPNASTFVNRISTAIDAEMTVFHLAQCELAYCPPINDVFDPVTVAADTLAKKITKIEESERPSL